MRWDGNSLYFLTKQKEKMISLTVFQDVVISKSVSVGVPD
jgi:hypothetical protein